MMAPGDDADQGIPVAPACWRCAEESDHWPSTCATCWYATSARPPFYRRRPVHYHRISRVPIGALCLMLSGAAMLMLLVWINSRWS